MSIAAAASVTSAVPIVLIPGIVCDEAVWSAQIEALADEHQLIVVDHQDRDSLVEMAKAVLEQAPNRFALAGHSMGGRVALELMRLAPERITRLALLDTGYEALASGETGVQERNKRQGLLDIARTRGMRAMGIEWARGMVYAGRRDDATFMSRIHDMIARKTIEQFAGQIRALLNRPNAADVLGAIHCPTLVLCGRDDAWAPWSRHVDIAGRIENSVLVAIDRCGHMSPMEQPDAVTRALRGWLNA